MSDDAFGVLLVALVIIVTLLGRGCADSDPPDFDPACIVRC